MVMNYPKMEWTPDRIARFWDWQSQYPEVYFTYLFGSAIAASLRGHIKGRSRVLDYGCGVGYLLPHLCAYAPEVYGADPSGESVKSTNERLRGTPSFKGAFLTDDPRFRSMKFDAILCVEVVEHLDDGSLDAVLADTRGLLGPGGVAIFTTPNNEDLSKSMILCPATGEVFHRWQHLRTWNRDSLALAVRAGGFEIVDIVETNMALSRNLIKRWIKRLLFGDPGKPHLVCVGKRAD